MNGTTGERGRKGGGRRRQNNFVVMICGDVSKTIGRNYDEI